ncbi:MAG: (d)CMP kinase [Clostridia bacterium]|nr:(d)CMP kinase [Clostridia bacterium]
MYKIAIDGPSGSGKSTLAKNLSKKLGFVYVDTGALYRTVALHMLREGIDISNTASVVDQLAFVKVSFRHDADGSQHVYLNGEDVNAFIRTPEVSMAASAVSAIKEVRAFLLDTQRDIANTGNVVMDGRDIGTVIFPDAQVKLFLTAGNKERAMRRYEELRDKGQNVTLESVERDMLLRDSNDSGRKEAPAIPAEDAYFLDNSELEPEETLARALEIISGKIDI